VNVRTDANELLIVRCSSYNLPELKAQVEVAATGSAHVLSD
jgi:hypothetical protein